MAYTNWQIGDIINICTQVEDFCGGGGTQVLNLSSSDMQKYPNGCTLSCDAPPNCTWDCIDTTGIEIIFKAVRHYTSTLSDAYCGSGVASYVYRELGRANSNSTGTASIQHLVSNQDRLDYLDAIAHGQTYDIVCCINDPQPTGGHAKAFTGVTILENLCAGVVCREGCIDNDLYDQTCNPATGICEPNSTPKEENSVKCTATHILDINVEPHSWYTPGDAASQIVNSLSDLNGAIINGLTEIGYFNWTYLDTEIITESDNVTIRIYLQEVTLSPLLSQYHISSNYPEIRKLVIGPWTILAIGVAVVIIGIGMIVGYSIYRAATLLLSETYTKDQVGNYTNDILERMMTNCETNFPDDPVGYANCVKSGIQSVTGAAQDFFDDPAIGGAGETAAGNIDTCVQDYNNSSSPKYHDSVALKECTNKQNKDTQKVITDHTQPEGSSSGALLLLGIAGLAMLGMMRSGGSSVLKIQTEKELTGKK